MNGHLYWSLIFPENTQIDEHYCTNLLFAKLAFKNEIVLFIRKWWVLCIGSNHWASLTSHARLEVNQDVYH